MRNTVILLAGLCFFSACKTTEEKQTIAPVALSTDLQANVTLKGGKQMLITNRLENVKMADIEKITVLNDDATWEFFYKDEEKMFGEIKLRKKSPAHGIDRSKILIVLDGVQTPEDFDLNSVSSSRIQSISVYKGSATLKEKYNTTKYESVIEIVTK